MTIILRGNNNFVAGIYPLCSDETCHFLAIDFDGGEWSKDVAAIREVCSEFQIPIAVERSRSGQGAHAWFFFQSPLSAALARKFGSALLTCAMNKKHDLKFQSYDRFFSNQDTLPKGGLGNLIALPLQKAARKNRNSEFIDEHGKAFDDQWAFLSAIRKLTEDELEMLTTELSQGNELGELKRTTGEGLEEQKPWEAGNVKLQPSDFPEGLEIIKANMLFIPKKGKSQRALNHLKRLAAFQNPEFYKAQAMRLSVAKIPRIISCAEETVEYLCLPRGCEADLRGVGKGLEIDVHFREETNRGKSIDVTFKGSLRDEQSLALEKLMSDENGILSGTTAFGKTVVAIKLIAERKVNTLILVDRVSLVAQWQKRLTEFLAIHEILPDIPGINKGKKKTRKKNKSLIGQLVAGKDNLSGILSVTGTMPKNRRRKGLSAIIFCLDSPLSGSLRIQKKRTCRFRNCIPKLYSEIVENEMRNQQIIEDVAKSHENGRNCLVLTQRTAHVELLAKKLSERIPNVIRLRGGMGAKETREMMARITEIPRDKVFTIVATGKYAKFKSLIMWISISGCWKRCITNG